VPFAIDECSAVNVQGDSFIMPTCVDSTHVDVSTYSDSTCSSITSMKSYNSSSGQDFNCGGTTTYLGVSLGADSCTSMVYVGVGSCVQHSSSSQYYSSWTCTDSAAAQLMLYDDSTCSGTAANTYSFTDTCAYVFKISSDIYGQIDSCYTGVVTTTINVVTSSEDVESETTATTTAGSSTDGPSNTDDGQGGAGNMIAFKNIVGIFVMVAFLIANL